MTWFWPVPSNKFPTNYFIVSEKLSVCSLIVNNLRKKILSAACHCDLWSRLWNTKSPRSCLNFEFSRNVQAQSRHFYKKTGYLHNSFNTTCMTEFRVTKIEQLTDKMLKDLLRNNLEVFNKLFTGASFGKNRFFFSKTYQQMFEIRTSKIRWKVCSSSYTCFIWSWHEDHELFRWKVKPKKFVFVYVKSKGNYWSNQLPHPFIAGFVLQFRLLSNLLLPSFHLWIRLMLEEISHIFSCFNCQGQRLI